MSTSQETRTLISYLDAQRHHVLDILDGLDEEALRKPVLPSGWNCLGMVRHLALDVERPWFQAIVAGDSDVIAALDGADDAWQVPDGMTAEQVLDSYRAQSARANEILAATALDDAPAWWPEKQFGGWRLHSVREVALHVIAETACHAGHLDAVRELLDGRRWLVLN